MSIYGQSPGSWNDKATRLVWWNEPMPAEDHTVGQEDLACTGLVESGDEPEQC